MLLRSLGRASNEALLSQVRSAGNGTVPLSGSSRSASVTRNPGNPSSSSVPSESGRGTGEPVAGNGEKNWSNLFEGVRMASKGRKLGFIPPVVKDGKSVASLQQSEIAKMHSKWEMSLILFVVGYTPTIASVARFIAQNWNQVQKPNLVLHEDGYFIVQFVSLDDKNEILYSGPHSFYGKPVIVKQWSATFYFNAEVLKVISIWVQFPGLPLSCISQEKAPRQKDYIEFYTMIFLGDHEDSQPVCHWNLLSLWAFPPAFFPKHQSFYGSRIPFSLLSTCPIFYWMCSASGIC